jgi:electron-transferring-flavoprotein dehydrogenase
MSDTNVQIERQTMETDVVCVGFGPAVAGFLATLAPALSGEDGGTPPESLAMPGMPAQVMCYERADDVSFGVSGIATGARGIRKTLPGLDPSEIPMATPISRETMVYLQDPVGASRRPPAIKAIDKAVSPLSRNKAYEFPYLPGFLRKEEGLILSMGQFMSWMGARLMGTGLMQIWPGMPVAGPLIENGKVVGVRLADQGVEKDGAPGPAYMPGMDVRARLTVVGDGPFGPVGRQIDEHFGMPEGRHRRDWAVGMKMVVDLPESCKLPQGTVIHTMGYPEPEIFGFLYVHPENVASLGIFVPSWFDNPARTAYRYLQHWMRHPYLWRHLEGGSMRSWGAKSILEAGRRGEPWLAGEGYARIGEGSGATNVLTSSGVDEAWTSGALLGEAAVELLRSGADFSRANLEKSYVERRRSHRMDMESKQAQRARDGFQSSVLKGMMGMGLAGLSKGKLFWPAKSIPPHKRLGTLEEYYRGIIPESEVQKIREECERKGVSLHDSLMDRAGWPQIEFDGRLMVSQQDALLMGGKVQAQPGFADHVVFKDHGVCRACREKTCIEACSGQAILPGEDGGVPIFDREKCVHCGACIWNCSKPDPRDPEKTNVLFQAGSGGLHSAEN